MIIYNLQKKIPAVNTGCHKQKPVKPIRQSECHPKICSNCYIVKEIKLNLIQNYVRIIRRKYWLAKACPERDLWPTPNQQNIRPTQCLKIFLYLHFNNYFKFIFIFYFLSKNRQIKIKSHSLTVNIPPQ